MLAELFSFIIGIAIISQDSVYGGYQLKKIVYLVISVQPYDRTLWSLPIVQSGYSNLFYLGLYLLSRISTIVASYELSFLGSCAIIFISFVGFIEPTAHDGKYLYC